VHGIQNAPRDWDMKAAMRTPTLWLIAAFMCANMFVVNMMTVHQVVYLTDIGVSEIMAAGALGLMAGISGIARIVGGLLADKFQPRFVAAIACSLQTVALIILINASVLPLIYIYIVVFGTAYGWLIVSTPTIIGSYYGRKNYGAIYSRLFLFSTFMGAAGPVFAGFFFDITGRYLIPFSVAVSFCIAGAVSAFFARHPK
jgi:OFA family oxalate/formate antiporter-like MFS transporter